MPASRHLPLDDGHQLHCLVWGEGAQQVLGIHGITASGASFAPVARHLPDSITLLTPDLRGRGRSAELPGPYGLIAHAADCAAVLRASTSEPAVVVGESMGAYVAVMLAADYPELVARLVLVDGGLPAYLPALEQAEDPLAAVLAPVLARLRHTFASREDYLGLMRLAPALAHCWNDDVEAYLDYEMAPVEGGFRSVVNEAAVRQDLSENVTAPAELEAALDRLRCPVTLLRAERDLMDQAPPILPDHVLETWRPRIPQLIDEVLPGSNHYTIIFAPEHAARIALAVASA